MKNQKESHTDITNGNVGNCICKSAQNTCSPNCNSQQYGLKVCNADCGKQQNVDCAACDIYYSEKGICNCLQNILNGKTGECIPGKPWNGQGNPPIWILRLFSADLISSTVLNTGIENMQYMPDKNEGWTKASKH